MVATLNQAINETLNDPEYQKQMTDFGAELIGGPAAKLSTFLAAEKKKWAALIKKKSIKAN